MRWPATCATDRVDAAECDEESDDPLDYIEENTTADKVHQSPLDTHWCWDSISRVELLYYIII